MTPNDEVLGLARVSILRGWHNPAVKHLTTDAPRAESMAQETAVAIQNFYDRAAHAETNSDYLRYLLCEVGKAVEGEAFLRKAASDEEAFAKLPDMVRQRFADAPPTLLIGEPLEMHAANFAEPKITGDFAEPTWARLEIMGRRRYFGIVTRKWMLGAEVVHIHVPKRTAPAEFHTLIFFGKSVYSLTPCDEASARKWHADNWSNDEEIESIEPAPGEGGPSQPDMFNAGRQEDYDPAGA